MQDVFVRHKHMDAIYGCHGHIPAQISKGLEIQLLHLLLAEPVAHSPAFQESLHVHCAPVPALEANGATEVLNLCGRQQETTLYSHKAANQGNEGNSQVHDSISDTFN